MPCASQTSLESIQETVSGALANKNPSVKAETASFMARALCYCTPAVLTKKLLKVIVTDLLKGVSEPGKEGWVAWRTLCRKRNN